MAGHKHWDLYRLSIKPTSKERRDIISGDCCIDPEHAKLLLSGALSQESWKKHFEFLTGIIDVAYEPGSNEHKEVKSQEQCSLFEEYMWWSRGCPTCFVASTDIVDLVYNARYDLDFSGISFPGGRVAFSFPDGATVNGIKLRPCIFAAEESLSVTERDGLGDRGRTCVSGQDSLDCFMSGDDGAFASLVDKSRGFSLDHEAGPISRHRDLMKVCIGLSAYVKAFPASYREGFPKDMQSRDVRCFGSVVSNMTLDFDKKVSLPPSGSHESPHLHWRQGHFRTYRDDRYKRDPDGSYKIGYVRDAIVGNGTVIPKTVEKVTP